MVYTIYILYTMIRMTKLVPFTTDEKMSTAGTAEPERFKCSRHGELFY